MNTETIEAPQIYLNSANDVLIWAQNLEKKHSGLLECSHELKRIKHRFVNYGKPFINLNLDFLVKDATTHIFFFQYLISDGAIKATILDEDNELVDKIYQLTDIDEANQSLLKAIEHVLEEEIYMCKDYK